MRPLVTTIHVIAILICFGLLLLSTGGVANAQQQCPINGSFTNSITANDSTETSRLLPVVVKGTSLEDPSQNAVGGGLNSSVTVALPNGGLVNGDTLDVQFLTNVVMNGRFRFFVSVEGLP